VPLAYKISPTDELTEGTCVSGLLFANPPQAVLAF
jgi:hypothetical protein